MTSIVKKVSDANAKLAVASLMFIAGAASAQQAGGNVVGTKDVLSKSGINNYDNGDGDFAGIASDLGATAINAGTVLFLIVGFFIFGLGILKLKNDQERGTAGWMIAIGGILAVVGFAFGMFAGGFANLFGAK